MRVHAVPPPPHCQVTIKLLDFEGKFTSAAPKLAHTNSCHALKAERYRGHAAVTLVVASPQYHQFDYQQPQKPAEQSPGIMQTNGLTSASHKAVYWSGAEVAEAAERRQRSGGSGAEEVKRR
ncbi:hypothetical protein MSG28_016166 [Choristoneura fumiferana]|uniref:Uncharacterized protein n=1 Tax=Choristoneura fumiferana TaxID=7141 RepID=A0ACC0K5K9_CHOFU|nr:hypothetical protein MSG28_016166 [Choristoneura fumiferana]